MSPYSTHVAVVVLASLVHLVARAVNAGVASALTSCCTTHASHQSNTDDQINQNAAFLIDGYRNTASNTYYYDALGTPHLASA